MSTYTSLGDLLSGGMASVINISVTHPLYTIKSCLMARRPVGRFYHGYTANLACDLSVQPVNFYLFPLFKDTISQRVQRELTPLEKLAISFMPGIVSAVPLTCLERAMIIQQIRAKPTDSMFVGSSTMSKTLKEILAVEGIKGLSRGLIPTMFRESSCTACFFGISKYIMPSIEKVIVGENNENKTELENTAITITSFFASGLIGGTVTTPFDIIKTRMQQNITPEKITFTGILKGLATELAGSKQARVEFAKALLARSATLGGSMVVLGLASDMLISRIMPSCFYKNNP